MTISFFFTLFLILIVMGIALVIYDRLTGNGEYFFGYALGHLGGIGLVVTAVVWIASRLH